MSRDFLLQFWGSSFEDELIFHQSIRVFHTWIEELGSGPVLGLVLVLLDNLILALKLSITNFGLICYMHFMFFKDLTNSNIARCMGQSRLS